MVQHLPGHKAGDGDLQEQGTGNVRGQDVITGIATFPQSMAGQVILGRQVRAGKEDKLCSLCWADDPAPVALWQLRTRTYPDWTPRKPQAAHEQRRDICILSVPSWDRAAQGCPHLSEHRADSSRELHPRENTPKKGWMNQTLQSASSEQVQHSHNHTLTLLKPETARTFVEPHGLHDKSVFVQDVDFFN